MGGGSPYIAWQEDLSGKSDAELKRMKEYCGSKLRDEQLRGIAEIDIEAINQELEKRRSRSGSRD